MRKVLFSIIMIVGLAATTYAQDYNTGIGLRGGNGWGITLKHFVSSQHAFEGLFYGYNNGFNVTGLYEYHNDAFDVDNLRWYCGFGAHIGSYNHSNANNEFVLGADAILGIEYTFTEAPINIGVDLNPYLNLTARTGLYVVGAISIRYTF